MALPAKIDGHEMRSFIHPSQHRWPCRLAFVAHARIVSVEEAAECSAGISRHHYGEQTSLPKYVTAIGELLQDKDAIVFT